MRVSSKLYFNGPRTPIWWNVKSSLEYELYVEILTTLAIKLRRDNKKMNYKRKLFWSWQTGRLNDHNSVRDSLRRRHLCVESSDTERIFEHTECDVSQTD